MPKSNITDRAESIVSNLNRDKLDTTKPLDPKFKAALIKALTEGLEKFPENQDGLLSKNIKQGLIDVGERHLNAPNNSPEGTKLSDAQNPGIIYDRELTDVVKEAIQKTLAKSSSTSASAGSAVKPRNYISNFILSPNPGQTYYADGSSPEYLAPAAKDGAYPYGKGSYYDEVGGGATHLNPADGDGAGDGGHYEVPVADGDGAAKYAAADGDGGGGGDGGHTDPRLAINETYAAASGGGGDYVMPAAVDGAGSITNPMYAAATGGGGYEMPVAGDFGSGYGGLGAGWTWAGDDDSNTDDLDTDDLYGDLGPYSNSGSGSDDEGVAARSKVDRVQRRRTVRERNKRRGKAKSPGGGMRPSRQNTVWDRDSAVWSAPSSKEGSPRPDGYDKMFRPISGTPGSGPREEGAVVSNPIHLSDDGATTDEELYLVLEKAFPDKTKDIQAARKAGVSLSLWLGAGHLQSSSTDPKTVRHLIFDLLSSSSTDIADELSKFLEFDKQFVVLKTMFQEKNVENLEMADGTKIPHKDKEILRKILSSANPAEQFLRFYKKRGNDKRLKELIDTGVKVKGSRKPTRQMSGSVEAAIQDLRELGESSSDGEGFGFGNATEDTDGTTDGRGFGFGTGTDDESGDSDGNNV